MGRRYYCDYCDKSFVDTPAARKRHLDGANHQRLRKLHYDSIQSSTTTEQRVCRRFQQTGFCPYGFQCKYSHLASTFQEFVPTEKPPSLEEWLAKRAQMRADHQSKGQSSKGQGNSFYGIRLPTGLPPVHLLPPSVLPPVPGSEDNLPSVSWG